MAQERLCVKVLLTRAGECEIAISVYIILSLWAQHNLIITADTAAGQSGE